MTEVAQSGRSRRDPLPEVLSDSVSAAYEESQNKETPALADSPLDRDQPVSKPVESSRDLDAGLDARTGSTVEQVTTVAKASSNKALAAELRRLGKTPHGEVWDSAKRLLADGSTVEEAAKLA
jgi:hypothetical protein